jgi:hypothetical protein
LSKGKIAFTVVRRAVRAAQKGLQRSRKRTPRGKDKPTFRVHPNDSMKLQKWRPRPPPLGNAHQAGQTWQGVVAEKSLRRQTRIVIGGSIVVGAALVAGGLSELRKSQERRAAILAGPPEPRKRLLLPQQRNIRASKFRFPGMRKNVARKAK